MRSEVASVASIAELRSRFPALDFVEQPTADAIPTLWIPRDSLVAVLDYLKREALPPYSMLYDLTAIDERRRTHRSGQPTSDFTVVYHLVSFERNEDIRLKVALHGEFPNMPSAVSVFSNANWYEREVWDMFGIHFEGHPHLRRILMPVTWNGHPLRKEHPARATEMGEFTLPESREIAEQEALRFDPKEWGMKERGEDIDYLFLNLGPHHPGTHGLLRVALQLDGEEIVDSVPDIGFHHRGAEKMAERQSFHTFIPYTDRVDYLGGVMNNLAYLLAVEKLAGIEVPLRAQTIRVMLAELFRISSHLVWYATFAQDTGMLSPAFYMFNDRERLLRIVQSITGGRMHPSWFRIGGVAQDLPRGWDRLVKEFVSYLPRRLREYDSAVMKNRIFKGRVKGVGAYTTRDAVEWGVTGPGLRATGFDWDYRKRRPYGGYERFEFEVPTGSNGDSYDRALVRIEEMRQSLRIIEQCLVTMPEGPYKSEHPLTTPPRKERTMKDIETLITHFLGVTWGPVIPAGEASFPIEATKGSNCYYVISDESTNSYRTRIRTPSFAHLQMIPFLSRGLLISDFIVVLGSIDFVLADVDR